MNARTSVKAHLRALPQPALATLRCVTIRPLRAYIRYAPWSFGKLFLYDAIAGHLWWLETEVDGDTLFGSTLRVDASDIVGKHIYYFGVWEPSLTQWMKRRLQPGQVFIDVGANVGYYSLLASNLVGPAGRVVSIEAMPSIFDRLKQNLTTNGATNVRAINSAAWTKAEKVKIFAKRGNPSGVTTLMPEWAHRWQLPDELEIDAKPLSEMLSPDEIASARMIKIDVEGAEWHVITEMQQWLDRTSPELEIAIEISRSMLLAQGKTLEDLLAVFEAFGFHAYRLMNDYLAVHCIHGVGDAALPRIANWPDAVDQVDLVFSRVDAPTLLQAGPQGH